MAPPIRQLQPKRYATVLPKNFLKIIKKHLTNGLLYGLIIFKEDRMATYKISEQNIEKAKRKYLLVSTFLTVIAIMSGFIITAIRVNDLETVKKIIIPFVLIAGIIVYFPIKFFRLNSFFKSILSLTYIIKNDRFIIKYNEHERLNISKGDIKQIIHYKNDVLMLLLVDNKKIYLNKKMEEYNSLVLELRSFCEITNINKNHNKILNILSGILSGGIVCILLFSNNMILVLISGVAIIILFIGVLIFILSNKNIDKKTKRTLLFVAAVIIYISVDKILKII